MNQATGYLSILRTIALLLLLLPPSITPCQKGCLSCDATSSPNKCLICDFQNQFFLNPQGQCQKLPLQSCLAWLPDLNNNANTLQCLKCESSQILDLQTHRCLDRPEVAANLQNCRAYFAAMAHCAGCQPGFFLDKGRCLSLITPLPNCRTHLTQTHCSVCQDGYFLLKDGKCQVFEQLANCALHNTRFCGKCEANKAAFRDWGEAKHLPALVQIISESISNKIDSTAAFLDSNNISDTVFQFCEAQLPPNCMTLDPVKDICSQCQSGFFLHPQTDTCLRIPTAQIQDCEDYESNTKCLKCGPGFYLSHATSADFINSCSKLTTRANCLKYDPQSDACAVCQTNYFKSSSEDCNGRRLLEIPYCLTLSQTNDSCLKCEDGFELDTKGSKCHLRILNCDKHNQTLSSFVCVACAQHYFLDPNNNTKCLLKWDLNCQQYKDGQECSKCRSGYYFSPAVKRCLANQIGNCLTADNDLCSECQSDFYFDNSNRTCKARNVPDCEEFHPSNNTCTKCTSPKSLSRALNLCIEQTQLDPLCKTFEIGNPFACSTCKANASHITKLARCLPNDTPNCLTFNIEGVCSECQSGFSLNAGFALCVKDSLAPFCIEFDFENSQCRKCQNGRFLNSSTASSCDLLTNVPNCKTYNSTSDICDSCLTNYYLDSANNECKSAAKSENCYEAATNQDQCLKCDPGYYLTAADSCDKSTFVFDSKCLFNSSTDPKVCSACPNDRFMVEVSKNFVALLENCLKSNPLNGNCVQCKSNFELGDNEECVENQSARSKCVWKSENSKSSLSLNSNCRKCRDDLVFDLVTDNSGSCAIREGAQIFNCTYPTNGKGQLHYTDQTHSLNSPFLEVKSCICPSAISRQPLVSGVAFCLPENDIIKSSNDTKCKVFDVNAPDKCLICKPGYSLENATGVLLDWQSCQKLNEVDLQNQITQIFTSFGSLVSAKVSVSAIDNCKTLKEHSGTDYCVTCNPNHVKIYDPTDASTYKLFGYAKNLTIPDSQDGNRDFEFAVPELGVLICYDPSDGTNAYAFLQFLDAEDYINDFDAASECGLAEIVDLPTVIRCVSCNDGAKTGTMSIGHYTDAEGYSVNSDLATISECVPHGLKRNYAGQMYSHFDSPLIQNLLKHDTCGSSDEVVVVVADITAGKPVLNTTGRALL